MRVLLTLTFLLTACAAGGDQAARFTGTVTPTTPGPLCPPSRAYLQLRDNQVLFAPDEGTWLLTGLVGPDGALLADKSRIAPNNQVFETSFEGRQTGNAITGTYRTPRCIATVALTRR